MAAVKLKKPKTTTLSVRLPIEHKEAIEKAAVDAKTNASAYAARVLFEAATGKAPTPTTPPKADKAEAVPAPTVANGIVVSDPKAIEELRRIGININQIAHALNAGRPTDLVRLVDAVAKVFALLKDPDAFMKRIAQMPAIILPATPKTAAPHAATPPAPHGPAAMPRRPWPEPTKPKPAPNPAMSAEPERRPIPAHVFGEIATALSQQTQPIKLPAAVLPPLPGHTKQADPSPYDDADDHSQTASPPAPERRRVPPSSRRKRQRIEASVTLPPISPAMPPPTETRPASPLPPDSVPRVTSPIPVMKEPRRDPPHPQTRHQLQDRAPVRAARPGPAKDDKPGRLGFLSKLWGR